jgi:hypothetical protein
VRERIAIGSLVAAVVLGAVITAVYGKASSATSARVAIAVIVGIVGLRLLDRFDDTTSVASPTDFEKAARAHPPEQPYRPDSIKEIEGIVKSAPSGRHLHRRLRPLLQGIARERLRAYRVDLDASPDAAAHLLGPDLYEIVRGDRPLPPEGSRGSSPQEVASLVDRLEAL